MKTQRRQMRKKAGFVLVRKRLQGGLRCYAALFLDSFSACAYSWIKPQDHAARSPTKPEPRTPLR